MRVGWNTYHCYFIGEEVWGAGTCNNNVISIAKGRMKHSFDNGLSPFGTNVHKIM